MSTPRRLAPILSIPLGLLVACASVARPDPFAGAPSGARTYRGLTLEEWLAFPWTLEARIIDGNGNVTLERNAKSAIPALGAFASTSDEAVAALRRLGADRDEDVREDAADALVDLAFSSAPKQLEALEAVMGLVADGDDLVSAAALGQLIGTLDDERTDWGRLGAEREDALVTRVGALLTAPSYEGVTTALAAIEVLGRRSEAHERRFRQLLAQPAGRYRSPDAAEELSDFAWDIVKPSNASVQGEELALVAARKAVELAPDDAGYTDTLAIALWRTGQREEALAHSRRAVEIAQSGKDASERISARVLEHQAMLLRDENWSAQE